MLASVKIAKRYKRASKIMAFLIGLIGLLTLVGWYLDIGFLKSISPDYSSISPAGGIGFILISITILLLDSEDTQNKWNYVGKAIASLVFLVTFLKLLNIFGFNFPIDTILLNNILSGLPAGQIASNAALNFCFISLALILVDSKSKQVRTPSHFLTVASLIISFMAFFGYMLGVKEFYILPIGSASDMQFAYPMPLYAAIGFIMTNIATLCLRPGRGFMSVIVTEEAGGVMIRRLYPLIFLTTVLMGWLRVRGQDAGFFSPEFGVALMVMVNLILAAIFIVINGREMTGIEFNRTEMSEKLQKEQNTLRTIISSIGEAVIVINSNFKVILCNDASLEMLKIKQKDILGKNILSVVTLYSGQTKKLPTAERPVYKTIMTGKKQTLTIQDNVYIKSTSGVMFPMTCVAAPLHGNNVSGVVVAIRDITQEKEIDNAKTEFVSLASHQLRTPLSTINWYAEMLIGGDGGKISKTQEGYLKEIVYANQRMVELVNSLLSVSRMELGVFNTNNEEVDLQEECDIVLGELKGKIKDKVLIIKTNFPKKISPLISDRSQVKIIFQNLISNAVKYTPNGGQIDISLKKTKDGLLITVSDNGYGIPKDANSKIFTKLYRADNIRQVETDGNGLGLYLVKLIVDKWKGKIWFESEQDKGTTFFINLPLKMLKKQ